MVATAALWLLWVPTAMGACVISKVSELAVVDHGRQPIVDGRINGQPVRALVDTGSSLTSIGTAAAQRLGLRTETAEQITVFGAGGEARASMAELTSLEIGMFTGRKVHIAVVEDRSKVRDAGYDMILGMDLLSRFTLEIDLAHGVIRFLKHDGCKPDQLVYWAKSWSQADIEALNPDGPRIELTTLLNGFKTTTYLDSGAGVSFATNDAARRAGILRDKTPAESNHPATGINGKSVATTLVTANTFSVGDDETIQNVKLRVGDLFAADTYETTGSHIRQQMEAPGLLMGHDFLLAHRVVILFKERKLFLTYNGGPVFQTEPNPAAPPPQP